MQENQMRTTSLDSVAAEQQRFMVRVYNWMGAGLGITGVMAFYIANTPAIFNILMGNPVMPIVLIVAQIGLVFWLATRVMAMSVSQATGVFLLYAGLTGITFSTLFVVYTAASITSTFLVTAGTFGAMSFYGYTTKKDLTSWGSFLFMGLIGIIIASLVNIFLQSPMMHWIITYAGVLIFVGLTAYDTQKIKEMNILGNEGTDEDTKEAIRGALTLYLDFINLFLMLLRIMGDRRQTKNIKVEKKLNFGFANLVLAVREEFIDVFTTLDLDEVADEFRKKNKRLIRIGSKYPNLTRQYLYSRGVTNFSIVKSRGATELMPAISTAELISDITSSGQTLTANKLRILNDGEILKSQACIFVSKKNQKKKGLKRILSILSK